MPETWRILTLPFHIISVVNTNDFNFHFKSILIFFIFSKFIILKKKAKIVKKNSENSLKKLLVNANIYNLRQFSEYVCRRQKKS